MARSPSPTQGFKYSDVLSVLARLHGVPASSTKTFRARVRHFQRLGIIASSPGKGQQITYSPHDVGFWAFVMELAALGMPPAIIKSFSASFRPSLLDALDDTRGVGGDTYFMIAADFLSWQVVGDQIISSGTFAFKHVDQTTMPDVIGDQPRWLIINIDAMKKALSTALEIEW